MSNSKQFKIVIIDNYDSFTYNLVHYFEALNCLVTVFRNDEFDIEELEVFDKIVLSPGPGLPKDAGLTMAVIKHYENRKPILGICLGQQAIAEFYGGSLKNLEKVYHGVASNIKILNNKYLLFNSLDNVIKVGRYHSWVVNRATLPAVLEITAVDENNEIMAIQHKNFDICAVQFHPESILTPNGIEILKNWLNAFSS